MSAQDEIKRLTAPDIRARKGGEPIVSLRWPPTGIGGAPGSLRRLSVIRS